MQSDTKTIATFLGTLPPMSNICQRPLNCTQLLVHGWSGGSRFFIRSGTRVLILIVGQV